ncbi:putative sigma-54 modulation protein [Dysgonomonas sp. PH5-45]|uniref:ribosome hibernation-promoting factor, HPF/YfiA family n=1 Tax=unclassified Dysgonomonas TaxID=2630389 RepID=UPI002473257D|nr:MULTISPECIES: ribosome-associated translation inhibitor RaiA [unclassified Dysgonomonas]MDH6354126.1 putative sigma-54 modulation protein [Dysgonomonas sp. PH5-45]MDH6387023.1 putative sigma-54 modulation protein [Dysgonomonas sp. PH5-37]
MDIRIQSVHFDATEQLKEFVNKKVSKLGKYSDDIIDADVILKVTKPESANNKDASIKLYIKNGDIFASKIADTFEEAIDMSVEALEKQLIKRKEKVQAK